MTTNILFADVAPVTRGEGILPLRVAGILPAIRGRDALDTKSKGGTPSPRAGEGRFLGHGLKGPLRRFAAAA